jgi:hypothetical protein
VRLWWCDLLLFAGVVALLLILGPREEDWRTMRVYEYRSME